MPIAQKSCTVLELWQTFADGTWGPRTICRTSHRGYLSCHPSGLSARTGTVPAVRLRLLALKAALKRGGGGGGGAAREAPATAAAAAPRHGRALRDRGPPAGRVLAEAAAAAATSESEADAPPPPPRKRTRPTQSASPTLGAVLPQHLFAAMILAP